MEKKTSYTDIVISDTKRGANMTEIRRHNVSTKVLLVTDII